MPPCSHKYVHLETIKQKGERASIGLNYGKQWIRIDRFFCEKCLNIKEIKKTAENWENRPDWW